MIGIQNLKELATPFITLFNGTALSMTDGKFDGTDLVNYTPLMFELAPAISGIGEVWAEIQDMDDLERQEFYDHIQNGLDGTVFNITDEIVTDFVGLIFGGASPSLGILGFLQKYVLNSSDPEVSEEPVG